MNKDLRSGKLALGPMLIAAIVALILIVGASTQNRPVLAASGEVAATKKPSPTPKPAPTPKPTPTPKVSASTSISGSVQCRGTIANTQDSEDLPNADMYMEIALFKGSPATLPAAKKPVALSGLSLMAINSVCFGGGPPCTQEGEFYGSITLGSGGGPNPMTLSFVQFPAAADQDDVLDGCQASFQVLPFTKGTQAYFVSTGPLIQDPAPSADPCGAIGTSMVLSCQEINS